MKVFIENEAGFARKNIYNEKTLEYKETFIVSRVFRLMLYKKGTQKALWKVRKIFLLFPPDEADIHR